MTFTLPTSFIIGDFSFNTINIFIVLGYLLVVFSVWNESKRDGFIEEKVYDLLVLSSLFGLFFGRVFYALEFNLVFSDFVNHVFSFWTPGVSSVGFLLGVLLFSYVFCNKFAWSFFRVSDILSTSFSLGLSIVALGELAIAKNFFMLFVFSSFLFLYIILYQLRRSNFKSGLGFSFFLCSIVLLRLFFRSIALDYVIYALLIVISVLNLYFRLKVSDSNFKFSQFKFKDLLS
jgi:hypothetical protein